MVEKAMQSGHNQLQIIYQDVHLVVLEKPAGLPACAASPKIKDLHTVEGWLQKKFPKAKLVHRLDNETSGLIIAAKNEVIFKKLRAIWNSDKVKKTYTALVQGRTPPSGKATAPIAHHPRKKKKMIVGGAQSRPAQTKFKTIKRFENFSLLSVEITTGVRHQIRVHLASLGHPIVGDKIYASSQQPRIKLERHFLHLSQLQLPHPSDGKRYHWHSPLPKELQAILKTFKSHHRSVHHARPKKSSDAC